MKIKDYISYAGKNLKDYVINSGKKVGIITTIVGAIFTLSSFSTLILGTAATYTFQPENVLNNRTEKFTIGIGSVNFSNLWVNGKLNGYTEEDNITNKLLDKEYDTFVTSVRAKILIKKVALSGATNPDEIANLKAYIDLYTQIILANDLMITGGVIFPFSYITLFTGCLLLTFYRRYTKEDKNINVNEQNPISDFKSED